MNVVIKPDAEQVTSCAYAFLRERLSRGGCRVLGLPTGSTPVALYKAAIAGVQRGELDFSAVHSFNLDEYLGLPPDHPQSYRRFMEENLFNHVNIKAENIDFLSGLPADIGAECKRYEQAIQALGGIDLQILGIGRDGHIGFNEPGTSLASRTHEATLTQETIADNQRFFGAGEEVPRWSLTMGVGTILDAREILLLATGASKAEAVAAMIEGPVSSLCTASALQLHAKVTLIIDAAAAAKLTRADYYRWIAENDSRMADYVAERRRHYLSAKA